MSGSRDLAMTPDAIRGYVDETLNKAAAGEAGDLVHAAKHLLAIPEVRHSPFESERSSLLCFLSNYAWATGDQDSMKDEAADAGKLTDDEITALCDYAVDHRAFESARAAVRRMERALFGV